MIAFVYGGAASGKSEVAEAIAKTLPAPRVYIATLEPFHDDAEVTARIEKHVKRRASFGMDTVECYDDMCQVALSGAESVMLEDTGNMTGNLLYHFGEEQDMPADQVLARLMAGADHLMGDSANLVVVGNDVFGGEDATTPEMTFYLQAIAQLSERFVQRAGCVVEVVCGIPIVYRGIDVLRRAGVEQVCDKETETFVGPWGYVLSEEVAR